MYARRLGSRQAHSLASALPNTVWKRPPSATSVSPISKFHQFNARSPKKQKYRSIRLDEPWPETAATAATSSTMPDKSVVPKPKCQFVKLDNGLRVVSIDRCGASSALGIILHTGSRFEEDDTTAGLSHLLELMAFRSTSEMSHLEQACVLEKLGAAVVCQASREHIMYRMEVLREYLPLAVPVLLGNVCVPTFAEEELQDAVQNIPQYLQILNENKEVVITDLLHQAAYNSQTLGRTQFALPDVNASMLREFHARQVVPDNMIFVGVNCDHDELCDSIQHSLGATRAEEKNASHGTTTTTEATIETNRTHAKPMYTGGYLSKLNPEKVELCHMAVAFNLEEGWNSEHLIPLTVLQMLLGGGDSFSTGGPGKGMHSRIYKRVLNQYVWMESCQTFSHAYSDSALFGFYAQMNPDKAESFCKVAVDVLQSLNSFTQEEVTRAKNSLKSSIALNLEMNCVVMEDIGRQVLMFDRVALTPDFHTLIDKVTADDLTRAAKELLKSVPTMTIYGNVSPPPSYTSFVEKCRQIAL